MKLLKRLVTPLVAMVFISMFMAFQIFPVAATPSLPLPTLEAPVEITLGAAGSTVSIDISARNLVDGWEIIGFQLSVPFNAEWLTPWLPSPPGDIILAAVNGGESTQTIIVNDVPYKPKPGWYLTTVAVLILPDDAGVYHSPFPDGDGIIITLQYKVKTAGASKTMPIELINTMILARVLNAELSGWKFKVNGKTGVGLGHKSTVGAPNTFEVQVSNIGTVDVYVRATFDIVSAMAVESVSTDIYLPVGQSTVISATWTASIPGHYEITGILCHPLFIIPEMPSTRTQTLRLDVKPL